MADTTDYAASVEHLSKKMHYVQILKDVTFSVGKGRILGLLGPNGAGKTTTLRIMVHLMRPTSGTVTIMGEDVEKNFTKAIAHVGAMIEAPEFYNYLTGFENLRLLADMSRKQISNEDINAVLNRVGLANHGNAKVKTYSLGMRQRLGVAQAILHKPEVLLLDEPINGLDPAGAHDFRTLMSDLRDQGTSIVISSHILSDIQSLADDLVVLQHGQVTYQGTMDELISHGTNHLTLITAKPDDTVVILQKLQMRYTRKADTFDIEVPAGDPHAFQKQLAEELFNAGIPVTTMQLKQASLEESFLALTKEEGEKANV
ncbi:ABC transporter ATP-binding protein [Schleiferilactobacillus harbinensis]|uniref:ABC transporter ATP-binding protein n=1 Tax=Schleiferilactobacillus harbinensis TaxID=304207 RepID=UPI0007B7A07A|nr:ABC transporter ATP-binding protein [Schleiferilactobacillus harbinensis]